MIAETQQQRPCVDIITMGCSKNLVDSQRVTAAMQAAGFDVRHNPDAVDADYVVINTCGFIGDAKEESVNMILECCRAKGEGRVGAVYVMGCLSERYRQELPPEIPEVDAWYGKFDWEALTSDIQARTGYTAPAAKVESPLSLTPRHYAYVKIAEGCNRRCAFCAIPLITGHHRSRKIEDIVAEVRTLVEQGVKEFNIIAQELTYYGLDLYGQRKIADIVDAIASIPGVKWIRLHYAYPAQFPVELLDAMARHSNVCRYLDIALQHGADSVLRRMHRNIDSATTRELLAEIRRRVPGIHIRTTMLVGFPGETDEEFRQLMDFVAEQRFERLGAFAYSEEDDTFAALNYQDDVPAEVKQQRLDTLMALQEKIALESNESKLGSRMTVIIDSETDEYYVGRTEFDSPEVDPEVLVRKTRALQPGDFCDVEIVEALPYELIAIPVEK